MPDGSAAYARAGDANGLLAPIPGLVWAFRIHADGSPEALPVDAPLAPSHDGVLWLHFNLADMRACRWIAGATALPDLGRAFLLNKDTHQQLRTEGGLVCALIADVELDLGQPTDRIGRVAVVVGTRYLVSGRRAPLGGIHAVRAMIESGATIRGPIELLETMVVKASDAMAEVATRLGKDLDAIEDKLLEEDLGDEQDRLGPNRRKAVRLHRQLQEMLGVLHRIERDGSLRSFPSEFADVHSRLTQRIEALNQEVIGLQERSRLLHDEIDAKLMAETNRNLHTLTIVTILFLPPTLVTGIFGMNLKGLPFTDSEVGFWWAVLMSLVGAAATYALIRRLRRRGAAR